MIVYPAIDILDGRCVRMTAGDFATAEEVAPDPISAAKRLVADGAEWLHIVDLNGARTGTPENLHHIRAIANRFTVRIQAGGGIRDFDTAEEFAEAGVSRVVVGTAAVREPELIGRTVEIGGPEYLSIVEVIRLVMATAGIHRALVPLAPPYLRLGAWIFERVLPHPPVTRFWFDYLAADRTTDLNTLPRIFGLQPARMEGRIEYLRGRSWARELLAQQRQASAA